MQPIRTVIADDELLARRALRTLLAEQASIHVVGECRDGDEVVTTLRELVPDLLFLDVHMPGLDGFSALAATTARPVTVFVTAHKDHAVRAFDVDAVDYLLKPFDDERFARAVQRARLEVQRRRMLAIATDLAEPATSATHAERIAVRHARGVELVEPETIDWITALDYYAELHVAGRTLLLREPLADLESRLDPTRFVRIHRSTIVNVARVRQLVRRTHGDYEVMLADDTRLRLSRSRRAALLRLLPR